MNAERLTYLFNSYYAKTATEAEEQEFFDTLKSGESDSEVRDLIDAVLHHTEGELTIDEQEANAILQSILSVGKVPAKPGIVRPMRRRILQRVAAAAIIIGFLAFGGYLIFKPKPKAPQVAKVTEHDVPAPKVTKAVITLANGSQIVLDSVGKGTLAMQSNVKLMKMANGQISYQLTAGGGQPIASTSYNTLTNPRGSKVIDMTLSDGSRVWLNAGSSITYPVAFVGNERKVSIDGEAYFEVAHNAKMPFYVTKGDMEVRVLGTHFNVNAYDDEPDIKVTLLQGSVRVSQGSNEVTIKPGEQAVVNRQSKLINRQSNVDLDQVMAWKNGNFSFDNTNLQEVMRQVARWYDVDVQYEGPIPTDEFMGGTSRQANVSALLKVLSATGKMHFTIEGKKVIVTK